MLKGILQTDTGLLTEIRLYGCLFLCFADESPVLFKGAEGRKKLNMLWEIAVRNGWISGDLNGDGDVDDEGEAEVRDHTALARLFGLRVRYDGMRHDPSEAIPPEVAFVFGRYWWKGPHFVRISKKLKVILDPLGSSNTVRNGALKDTRWYYHAENHS